MPPRFVHPQTGAAGIPLVGAVGGEVMDRIIEGDVLRVEGGDVLRDVEVVKWARPEARVTSNRCTEARADGPRRPPAGPQRF